MKLNAKENYRFTTCKVIKGKRCYRIYIKLNDVEDGWTIKWKRTNRLNLQTEAAIRKLRYLRKLRELSDMIAE